MKKTVNIGDKKVALEATGFTTVQYRNVFPGRDIIRELIEIEEADDADEIDTGIYERLAYAMSEAPEDGISFADWMKQFGPIDVFMASQEIMDVWNGNAETQSKEENEEDEKNG